MREEEGPGLMRSACTGAVSVCRNKKPNTIVMTGRFHLPTGEKCEEVNFYETDQRLHPLKAQVALQASSDTSIQVLNPNQREVLVSAATIHHRN